MNHENKNRSIPFQKLEKGRSLSVNQDGLGPGRKIKNKRSFEKLKVDGVKIAYLSFEQGIEIAIKISNMMTGIFEEGIG